MKNLQLQPPAYSAWDVAWTCGTFCGIVGELSDDGTLDVPLDRIGAELEAMWLDTTDRYGWKHRAVPLPWAG